MVFIVHIRFHAKVNIISFNRMVKAGRVVYVERIPELLICKCYFVIVSFVQLFVSIWINRLLDVTGCRFEIIRRENRSNNIGPVLLVTFVEIALHHGIERLPL